MVNDPQSIESRNSLEAFLQSLPEDQQRQANVVMANRIALRVVPLVAGSRFDQGQHFAWLVLAVMRANVIARVGATWPTREITAAARASYATASTTASEYNANLIYARAARAAAAAAHSVYSEFISVAAYVTAGAAAPLTASAADLFWESIRSDADSVVTGESCDVLARPLWSHLPRKWDDQTAALRSQFARLDGYANALDQPWQVWWEWYAPIVDGKTPWNLPPRVATALERRIALGDNREGFWDRDPHVVTAEIASWVQEARLLLAAQQNNLGDTWHKAGQYFVRSASGAATDEAAAQLPAVAYGHQKLRERLAAFQDKALAINNSAGWRGFAHDLEALHCTLACSTDELPAKLFQVYDEVLAAASWLEFDNRLKAEQGNFQRPLPADDFRDFFEIVRTAAPWIREFPSTRDKDDAAGKFLGTISQDTVALSRRFAEAVGQRQIISEADRDLILSLLSALERAEHGPVSNKAAARGIATLRNLFLGILSVPVLFGETVLIKGIEDSQAGQKATKLIVEELDFALEYAQSLPPDMKAISERVIADVREKQTHIVADSVKRPPQR